MALIKILAMGSHGDVRPMVGLARELAAKGYEVEVFAGANNRGFLEKHTINFVLSAVDYHEIHNGEAFYSMFAKGRDLTVRENAFNQVMIEIQNSIFAEMLAFCEGGDVIVDAGSHKNGLVLASIYKLPYVNITYVDTFLVNKTEHSIGAADLRSAFPIEVFNRIRADIAGVSPVSANEYQMLINKQLLLRAQSKIFDDQFVNVPDNAKGCGQIELLEADTWMPPEELSEFLAFYPKPIVIGFGSMTSKDPNRIAQVVKNSIDQLNCGCVVLAGWMQYAADAFEQKNILSLPFAPHDWLYPKASVVIHHAGAGTCTAAVKAGVPSVCIPFAFDQFVWADKMYAMGLSSKPVPFEELSHRRLVMAVNNARGNMNIKTNLAYYSRVVKDENGAQKAADIIEEFIKLRV